MSYLIHLQQQHPLFEEWLPAAEQGNTPALLSFQAVAATLPDIALHLLETSAREGHADCVAFLCSTLRLGADRGYALTDAASYGHAACVALLLDFGAPAHDNFLPLRNAAIGGHCVRLLLPVSNPMAEKSRVLSEVANLGEARRDECLTLLAPYCDADQAFKTLLGQHKLQAADRLTPFISLEYLKKIAPTLAVEQNDMPQARARLSEDALKRLMPAAAIKRPSRL